MKKQSAFPWSIDNGESIKGETGMTLRDYFATKAMAALLSRTDYEGNSYQDVAEMAYIAADAMMLERDK